MKSLRDAYLRGVPRLSSYCNTTFWGDRCGRLLDPEGYNWYIATHVTDPTPAQMKKQMIEDMKKWQAPAGQAETARNES
jgi:hypothetical protein